MTDTYSHISDLFLRLDKIERLLAPELEKFNIKDKLDGTADLNNSAIGHQVSAEICHMSIQINSIRQDINCIKDVLEALCRVHDNHSMPNEYVLSSSSFARQALRTRN